MDTPTAAPTPRTSVLARASLALGFLGLLGSVVCVGILFAIPGIICGHIALSRLKAPGGPRRGRDMAIAGLVSGYLGIVAAAVIAQTFTIPLISGARAEARSVNCLSNLKGIGFALRMYAADHAACFPDDFTVLARLNYLQAMKVYTCPSTLTVEATSVEGFSVEKHSDYLYFGKGLTEASNGHAPASTILACDKPGNHQEFQSVLFADGHVKGFRGKGGVADLARREKFYLPGAP